MMVGMYGFAWGDRCDAQLTRYQHGIACCYISIEKCMILLHETPCQ